MALKRFRHRMRYHVGMGDGWFVLAAVAAAALPVAAMLFY